MRRQARPPEHLGDCAASRWRADPSRKTRARDEPDPIRAFASQRDALRVSRAARDGKILPQWEWVFEADQETQERTLLPVIEHADDYHVVVAGSGRGKDLLMPTRCKPISREVRGDWLAKTPARGED